MPRSELLPLEGQWVRWGGKVDTWAARTNGEVDVCIRAVRLYPWSFDEPLASTRPPTRTEHLWLRCPAAFAATLRLERLQPANGIGTVGWYRRADGTTDLGVRARVLTNAGGLQRRVVAHMRAGEWGKAIDLIDHYLTCHRNGSSILCAPNMSTVEIIADLEWSRQLAVANLSRLMKAARHPPARSPGRFRDLLTTRQCPASKPRAVTS